MKDQLYKKVKTPTGGWTFEPVEETKIIADTKCFKILKELVELKKLKDEHGKTPDYLWRQPQAWIAAKTVIEQVTN